MSENQTDNPHAQGAHQPVAADPSTPAAADTPAATADKSAAAADKPAAAAQGNKRAKPAAARKAKAAASADRHRFLASWIFGSLLLAFFIYVFQFAPDELPETKQRILAILSALLAGLFGFFLMGSVALDVNANNSRFGSMTIKATAGFALFVIVLYWWFSPFAPVKVEEKQAPPPDSPVSLYRIGVTVLDAKDTPVNDAAVQATIGSVHKKADGGWQLEIPAVNKPADGRVTVYASSKNPPAKGSESLVLANDATLAITIRMAADAPPSTTTVKTIASNRNGSLASLIKTVRVRGELVDDAGQPIVGALVWIGGYRGEAALTNADGAFSLETHAVEDASVELHISKDGFASHQRSILARSEPMQIKLRRQ